MSIYSRDYMKEEGNHGRSRHPRNWSIVTRLLVINIGVYVLNNLIFYSPQRDIFGLSLDALRSFHLWTPLTYQFVHASLWHLLGNMLGLFFLGRMLLDLAGPGNVLRVYLLGGFAGGFLQLAFNGIFGPDALIIGASASVLAIVMAVATLIPHRSIHLLLFFVIPISLTLRQVALILIAVNAVTLLFSFSASGGDGIAVMAHFGGMLFGWIFIRFGFHESGGRKKESSLFSPLFRRLGIRILPANDSSAEPPPSPKRKPFVTGDLDAILDKINEQGFQSLTEEERRTLEKGSEKLSRRIDRDS